MEPRAPFFDLAGHYAIDLPGARAVFTTRRGGGSEGAYASLNLGFATGDDPRRARANRERVRAAVGAPRAAYMYQVHGTAVRRLERSEQADGRVEADGQATALRGIAPAALGADCLTVAIAAGGAVAIVHAGWRGLADGVLEAGVAAVRALAPVASAPVSAAIGPGAGPCCYEVGPEVHARFAADRAARRGAHLDLPAIARGRLAGAGAGHVHDLGMCTICAPELFFSHRRDRGVTGRQAGLVWLT